MIVELAASVGKFAGNGRIVVPFGFVLNTSEPLPLASIVMLPTLTPATMTGSTAPAVAPFTLTLKKESTWPCSVSEWKLAVAVAAVEPVRLALRLTSPSSPSSP